MSQYSFSEGLRATLDEGNTVSSFELDNSNVKLTFDKRTGEPTQVHLKSNSLTGKSFPTSHTFYQYVGDPNFDNHYTFKYSDANQHSLNPSEGKVPRFFGYKLFFKFLPRILCGVWGTRANTF